MKDLSGVISTWDHMKTLTTTQSTSPSFLLQLQKSHRPDCQCSRSPREPSFPHTQFVSCLLVSRPLNSQRPMGSRITSSRIVTRSIKPSLTFARHLGAHRKPSSTPSPLYSASLLGGTSLVYLKFSTKDIRHSGVSSRHPALFERDY